MDLRRIKPDSGQWFNVLVGTHAVADLSDDDVARLQYTAAAGVRQRATPLAWQPWHSTCGCAAWLEVPPRPLPPPSKGHHKPALLFHRQCSSRQCNQRQCRCHHWQPGPRRSRYISTARHCQRQSRPAKGSSWQLDSQICVLACKEMRLPLRPGDQTQQRQQRSSGVADGAPPVP